MYFLQKMSQGMSKMVWPRKGTRPTKTKPPYQAGLGPRGFCVLLMREQTDRPKRRLGTIVCGLLHYVKNLMLTRKIPMGSS